MDLIQFTKSICRKSYGDVATAMKPLKNSELLELLDSKSIKVGDTATSMLSKRGLIDAAIDRLFDGNVRTKFGRLRVSFLVKQRGRACPRGADVFLHLLQDRTDDVVSNALFGLVFLQDKRHLGEIRRTMEGKEKGTRVYEWFSRAIEALEKEDPFIYSPYYRDAADVWKLDKKRFADRIGWS